MDGLSPSIDGSHSRGRDNHHAFIGLVLQVFQKGGLSRSRLTRKEDVRVGVKHQIFYKIKLFIGKKFLHLLNDYCQ